VFAYHVPSQATKEQWSSIVAVLRLIDFEGKSVSVSVDPIPLSWEQAPTSSDGAPFDGEDKNKKGSQGPSGVEGWAELPSFDELLSEDEKGVGQKTGSAKPASACMVTPLSRLPSASPPLTSCLVVSPVPCFSDSPISLVASLAPCFSNSPSSGDQGVGSLCVDAELVELEEAMATPPLTSKRHGIQQSAKPPKLVKGKQGKVKASSVDMAGANKDVKVAHACHQAVHIVHMCFCSMSFITCMH